MRDRTTYDLNAGTTRRAGGSAMATVAETADLLQCSTKTVRRYIADGRLTAHRVGPKMLRVDLADVETLLRTVPARGRTA